MKLPSERFFIVDAFKAVAAQLIVLHHLAAYGPLSDAVQTAFPGLIAWLYDNARMAVQVFLVIGGFLAARSLMSPHLRETGALAGALVTRYLRLTLPFLAALSLSIVTAMFARHWMSDDFIPDAPSWPQLLAHGLLLQSVLDFDALTAGAWYIAVDFQLFLLMAVLVWLGHRSGFSLRLASALTVLLAGLSLLWFNRNPALDDWAIYFFGAYGLGAATCWAAQRHPDASRHLRILFLLVALALVIDFRPRVALAALVAWSLYRGLRSDTAERVARQPLLQYLGRTSYALFLVHFPVLLMANTLFSGLNLSGPLAGSIGMLLTWSFSLWLADRFHRHIELPASQLKAAHLAALWQARTIRRFRYQLVTTLFLVLAIPV